MRCRLIAVAIAAGLGLASFQAAAAPADDTTTQADLAALQAQLAALQAKVDSLQQSAATTPAAVPTETVAAQDRRLAALEKAVNSTSVSGKMYFDFTSINEDNSDSGKTDRNGFGLDVKRFYLGFDHKFNDVWSANLTTDFQYSSAVGATEVFVKKAYVQGKFDDAAVLRIGSADMPWIPFAEKYYGLRYVENTLTDRLKYGNSADWGLHLGGDIGAGKAVNYAVSVVNGNGYKNPGRSKGVDVEARVGFVPMDNLVVAVGGYSGHRGQETQNIDAVNTASRGDLMVAYASDAFRAGAEYFTAKNWNNVLTPVSDKSDGYSLWASVAVADGVSLFARYDNTKLSKNIDRDQTDVYYNAGVEFQVTKGFKLAGVWKHQNAERTIAAVLPTHVQSVKTNEIGVFGEVSF